jgi:hypothetical protein
MMMMMTMMMTMTMMMMMMMMMMMAITKTDRGVLLLVSGCADVDVFERGGVRVGLHQRPRGLRTHSR